MERVAQKFTIPCVKQMANGNLLCDSGSSTRGSATGRRVDREGDGREGTWVYLRLIIVDV